MNTWESNSTTMHIDKEIEEREKQLEREEEKSSMGLIK